MFFTKMHGLGNDFVIIDGREQKCVDYKKLAVSMCDRHFGIGADGLLVVEKSSVADSKMRIYNSDGSEAEMCGNGIRCFARYLHDNKVVGKKIIDIETLDGIKKIELIDREGYGIDIKVNMGKPSFEPGSIPAAFDGSHVIGVPISVDGHEYKITSMLMGVPHTVIFVDDMEGFDIMSHGRRIEVSSFFPKKTNVNFVKVINENEYVVRTWERGAGLTLACGTGTCASLVACVLNKLTAKKALAHLAGGDLIIEWQEDGCVYMTGPAETVFTGEYKVRI